MRKKEETPTEANETETTTSPPRLIPRWAADVVKPFVSKDASRLKAIRIEPGQDDRDVQRSRLVATDGHRLIRLDVIAPPASEFPAVRGLDASKGPVGPVHVDPAPFYAACKAAPKGRRTSIGSMIPVLRNVCLAEDGEGLVLAVSDLETGQTFRTTEVEMDGRNVLAKYEQVIPEDAPEADPEADDARGCRFAVNARYLADICKALAVVAGGGSPAIVIHPPKTPGSPVKITASSPETGEAVAVLIPLRV